VRGLHGNFGLLAQYNIDWEHNKPLSRLKEALHVMRTFLDEGAITFEGDFFKYSGSTRSPGRSRRSSRSRWAR
jgi:alkanesulfonate monooxygenase SsuD/methylene tetrahydromethanopterin reductase-like flavin-dependent oxidoreductase (luciferase family)